MNSAVGVVTLGMASSGLVAVRMTMVMAVPCLVFAMAVGTAAGRGVAVVMQMLRLGQFAVLAAIALE